MSKMNLNIASIFKKINNFLKEVKAEIKKVNWPTTKETIRYTLIVIGVSVVTAVFLGGIDYLFTIFLNKFII
jgi:preprotein translocase subunit SecE